MAKYKSRHGYDGWPSEMSDVLIDLTVAKKWRKIKREWGVDIKDPWVPFLNAARALLDPRYFIVSPWTEEHFHDFTMQAEVITWGCASSSKAQPLGSTVYTPTGPAVMGDIEIGDLVMTRDGRPTRVVKTHDVGEQDVYKVTFSDRTSCLCAGSHLWSVAPRRKAPRVKVVTAEWLCDNADPGRYSVPLCSPVELDQQSIDVDPYVLGALIGDGGFGGSAGNGVLRFSSADSDIIEAMRSRLVPGYSLKAIPTPKGLDYCLVRDGSRGRRPNQYIRALKRYGLWGKLSPEKFIPKAYLYNTVEVRRALLAGLLDTDGCVDAGGAITFSSTSPALADAVAWLVRSLGGIARSSTYPSSYRKEDGTKVDCLPVSLVSISVADTSGLFLCRRKALRTGQGARGTSARYIHSVCRTGERVPMKCITVADTEGLYLTDDFIVTHNSNDYGLMLLLDWMVDPYATTTIVGSTTKVDLRVRIWESMVRYHEVMKNNTLGFSIPGHVSEVGFMISNEKVAGDAESMGKKAAIRGIALNEDGRIQGAHLPNVRVLVDELATISNFDALDKGLANLSIAEDFRFYGLANPHTWDDRSCKYCLPPEGTKVDVDTGSWISTRGIFVRHHDGLKSPAYLDPSLESKFFFLMNRRHVSDNLRRADGNWDAPLMWEQVRGFPLSNGSACPTVLDALVAAANGISGPMPKPFLGGRRLIGRTAGVDPAWSDQGDDSIYAGCAVYEQDGKAMLDFSGLVRKIPILASSGVPITQQQRDFVIRAIRQDGGPELRCLAGDASGNQGLMDAIVTFVGGCPMAVNNSTRASEYPIKAVDGRPAREYVKDRGTEAWLVLAEFAKAGQVYGLPAGAVDGLTSRRFATRPGSTDTVTPLRLEAKEMFMTRFKGSPNETDACALAALAAKERLGIMPFGALPPPTPASLFPGMTYGDGPAQVTNADTGSAGSYSGSDQDSGGYGSLD